jgi:hypothetical protein
LCNSDTNAKEPVTNEVEAREEDGWDQQVKDWRISRGEVVTLFAGAAIGGITAALLIKHKKMIAKGPEFLRRLWQHNGHLS